MCDFPGTFENGTYYSGCLSLEKHKKLDARKMKTPETFFAQSFGKGALSIAHVEPGAAAPGPDPEMGVAAWRCLVCEWIGMPPRPQVCGGDSDYAHRDCLSWASQDEINAWIEGHPGLDDAPSGVQITTQECGRSVAIRMFSARSHAGSELGSTQTSEADCHSILDELD